MANYLSEGKLVGLRAFNEEDLDSDWYDWFNDREVTKTLKWGAIPNTRTEQREFYHNVVIKATNKVVFAVEDKKSKKLIGVCSIGEINWIFHHGEIAIVIGDKKFHRGVVALEVYHLIVKHGFEQLNLHKLKSVFSEENDVSYKLCERIGFQKVGVLKDEFFKNGQYGNSVILELLREDWLIKDA